VTLSDHPYDLAGGPRSQKKLFSSPRPPAQTGQKQHPAESYIFKETNEADPGKRGKQAGSANSGLGKKLNDPWGLRKNERKRGEKSWKKNRDQNWSKWERQCRTLRFGGARKVTIAKRKKSWSIKEQRYENEANPHKGPTTQPGGSHH